MMWRRLVPALAAALVLLPSAAAAQETPDTVDTAAPRPFVEGGPYDKPYQTRLLGRTALGGYAEAHARWERTDGVRQGLGFELRRWNLFTATQVNDHVRIGAELEFEELAQEVTLEFAAIDFVLHPVMTLRAGAILAPIGRFNLSHDSPQNEFTDRPLVSTEIVGTALTEVGLGLLGQFDFGHDARITYETYAVNGFHEGVIRDSPDGTRIPAGKGNAEDGNSSPAWVGRVAFSPRLGYELGLSAHHGAYNQFVLDGEEVARRNDVTLLAVDAEATLLGIELSGEAVRAAIDLPIGLQGLYASHQDGLYVQATYGFGRGWIAAIPTSYFEVGVRYDAVDFDADIEGDEARRGTLGINFRPGEDVALKLNYVRGRERDRFNNPADVAGVLFSVATYF